MKPLSLSATAALALLLASGGPLRSQQPLAESKTPETRLQEIRAAQEALLKAQAATLQRLEALEKEADQLRIFAKRS